MKLNIDNTSLESHDIVLILLWYPQKESFDTYHMYGNNLSDEEIKTFMEQTRMFDEDIEIIKIVR